MINFNNKGFVLIETLIVSVFVVTVFTFLYINVMPLVGNYEEEENYDSIDTKYIGNLLKNEITYGVNQDKKNDILDAIRWTLNDESKYIDVSKCDQVININASVTPEEIPIYGSKTSDTYKKCNELRDMANIKGVYITRYNITKIKNRVKTENQNKNHVFNSQADAYIDFLPTYEHIPSAAQYRIILSIRDIYNNDKLYFGTIELDI